MKKKSQNKGMRVIMVGLFLCCLCASTIYAQPVTTPDTRYGNGGTKITTVTDDGLGTVVTTEEYYDGYVPPRLREKVIRTRNVDGETSVVTTEYVWNKGQKVDVIFEKKYNRYGEVVYSDTVHYDKEKVSVGRRHVRLPDGSWEYYEYNQSTGQFELKKVTPAEHVGNEKSSLYIPRSSIFVGYCYLGSLENDNGINFPTGANFAFTYYFNRSLGVMADISAHTKKEDMEKISRWNFSAGLTYRFVNKNGSNILIPHLHLLAGIGTEMVKVDDYKTSESGLIAALGGGADVRLSPSASLRFAVDVLANRLNDETIKDYRIVGGVVIHLSELFEE